MSEFRRMDDDIQETLVDAEAIQKRVKELGAEITKDYADKKGIVMIGILRGAVPFYADLARAMDLYLTMDFMAISSYGDAQKTSGIVRIAKDIDTSITGKHVIIAEDIMDSGLTLSHLIRILKERHRRGLQMGSERRIQLLIFIFATANQVGDDITRHRRKAHSPFVESRCHKHSWGKDAVSADKGKSVVGYYILI